MRWMFTHLLKTTAVLLFPLLAFAQKPDFTIYFKSGKVVPAENLQRLTRDSDEFRKSVFKGKHYITIQLQRPLDESTKRSLNAAGIELIEYITGNSYTAAVREGFNINSLRSLAVRSVFLMSSEQKSSPELWKGKYPTHAVKQIGFIDVNVITYEVFNREDFATTLQLLGAELLEEQPMFRTLVLRVPLLNLPKLIEQPFVQWVEPIDPPNQAENLLGRSLHNVNVLNDGVRNLKGTGVKIGVWDGGEIDKHLDFSAPNRLVFLERGSTSSHGTHVGGTIGSAGLINPKARGMAPNSQIFSADFSIGSSTTEIYNANQQHALSISSHSYGGSIPTGGCVITGSQLAYTTTSRATDININSFPNHLHVHSAGNSQGSCASTSGFYTITGSGKSAKNNIVVANIQSNDAISTSSSFGPVHDGRVKPEISAFGTSVLSTYTPNNTYATISGTSMSTPGVSGTLALLVERYRQLNSGNEPVSSLIKALVCNTATDLGNPGPDYKFGFGKINGLAAVRTMEENRYLLNTISLGETKGHTITVPAGALRLKVMLTWNDPAASANASTALVNNLDLSVISGATLTLPWILDPLNPNNNATRAIDNISNIEQVTIDNPASGEFTFLVNGTAIPVGSNQQYALTWIIEVPSIEVTYPNGGESLDPADSETISWTATGVTGNQKVEYSLDNGANWTTISSTVPATTTRHPWTIPGVSSSQAKIRVSSGILSDESDNSFSIFGSPKNFTTETGACEAGTINVKWTPVDNATHYDILFLDKTNGTWIVSIPNITGEATAISGLTGGQEYWFSIRAKNSITGAVSERALAISAIAPTGTLITPGAISGTATVCSNSKGVEFSVGAVTGATSYIWKVPAGATVANGQGTTSVFIDFGAGSTSGNVSVYATDGVCQTAASVFAITITQGPALAITPANPSICTGGNVVITASAPGSTGTEYTWSPATGLNNTTGATVTASPSETTTYTVVATNPNGCVASFSNTVYVADNASAINSNSPVCTGGTLQLNASPAVTNKFASLKITEVVQFRDGSGSTPVYPFYIPASSNADDMLEISNVDNVNAVDVSGVVFELWTGSILNRSYIIPNGVIIPANQTMVIYLGIAGIDYPEYRFFRTGGTNNPLLSSTAAGLLLKSPATGIIDVVATNSYVWPAASGVTTAHWSGNISSSLNLAGVIRTAATDNNTAANWAVTSTSALQSISIYNGGYTNVSPYSWTGPGGFASTEQNPVRTGITAAMAGDYVVNYTGGTNGCVASQTTVVTVNTTTAPTVTASANFPVCIGSTLNLTATSSDAGVTYNWAGPNGFTSTEQNPVISNMAHANAGTYEVTVAGSGCTASASVSVQLKPMKGLYRIGPGADYNSLTDALNDYHNASCINGPIILELQNSYRSSYESFPIIINNVPAASEENRLIIRPATGANPQIISSVNGSAIIRLNGARYVTIDGRAGGIGEAPSLIIENMSTSNLAGTSAITFINGAQNNTINYVKVLNGATNGSQAAGNILFSTSATVGNSHNTISNCFLAGSQESQTQMRYGLVCDGSNAIRNNNNIISGNEFYSVVFRAMPLNAGLGNNWQILNNHFYWHGGTFSTAGQKTILMSNTGSSGHTISGNYIGGSEPFAEGLWQINTTSATNWYGMDLTLGTVEVTTISNNTIKNVSITNNGSSYGIIGIGLFAGAYNVTDNTISDLTFTSSNINPLVAGIFYGNAVLNTTFNASNNTISNLTNGSATANSGGVYGMVLFPATGQHSTLSKNNIFNLRIPNTTSTGSVISGMLLSGVNNNDILNLENNMISLGHSGTNRTHIYGIQSSARAAALNAYYNSIVIGGTALTGSGNSAAFFRNGAANETAVKLRNNIFNNDRTGGTGKHYAVMANQTTPSNGWGETASDFNNYYTINSNTVAFWGTADQSFNSFKTASNGDDNSRSMPVVFENTAAGDLRIKTDVANCGFDDLGTPVEGITNDIFSTTRSNTTPDIGAHEFTLTPEAPVSGGDITDCEQSPVQTLTATATAPEGSSIVWYNTTSGGNVVISPVLSGTGSVTYYAASKSSIGCENTSRIPVTLTINEAPQAPVSGGDQSECEASPVQTLTATATATPGLSVVWYDAAVNGNVVVSPILSATGSVTFYAASKNNITNCESLTRTAVTLTIKPTPAQPLVTVVDNCGSSVLTVTNREAGAAILWSTGATTASITVTTSGIYTVTQTGANSCISALKSVLAEPNSPPVVTKNAGITGPTTFCANEVLTYTVNGISNTTGYNWTFPAGWKVSGSKNGATIIVVTSSTAGTVSVVGVNGACTTGAFNLNVKLGKCKNTRVIEPSVLEMQGLNTILAPNPTTAHFIVRIETSNTVDPIILRVVDILGRVVELKNNVVPNSNVILGGNYKAGIYLIEVAQGELKTQTKLIKQ